MKTFSDRSNARRAAKRELKHSNFEIAKNEDGSFYWIDLSSEAAEAAAKENDAPEAVSYGEEVDSILEAGQAAPTIIGLDMGSGDHTVIGYALNDAEKGKPVFVALSTWQPADDLIDPTETMTTEEYLATEAEEPGFGPTPAAPSLKIDLASCGLTPEIEALILAMGEEAGEAIPVAKPRPRLTAAAWAAADAGELPPIPTFPASNATYEAHANKMQELAMSSMVDMVAEYPVKGTNTYAKALRSYRDALLAYLSTKLAEPLAKAA